MVIELSGVQFGLKSYAWFQNQTSAQREFEFEITSMISDQIALHSVQYHYKIVDPAKNPGEHQMYM